MADSRRSLFDWLTTAAAWCGVIIASLTGYFQIRQYQQSQERPMLEYGQYGARYTTKDKSGEKAIWRLTISNVSTLPATNVYVKAWDVPKAGSISCSVGFSVQETSDESRLLLLPVIPPETTVYLSLGPTAIAQDKKLVPYTPMIYSASGRAKYGQSEQDWARIQIFETLAHNTNFVAGKCGFHRNWDTPVTDDEIKWGMHYGTVETH